MVLNINDDQRILLLEHIPQANQYIEDNDINPLLEDLDDKITEVGFDANYDLNDIGMKLQKLYDELYDQN